MFSCSKGYALNLLKILKVTKTFHVTFIFILAFPLHAKGSSLFRKTAVLNLPPGYTLDQFTQMNFSNSIATFGLTNNHNFFPTMSSSPISQVNRYSVTFASTNNIILDQPPPPFSIINKFLIYGGDTLYNIANAVLPAGEMDNIYSYAVGASTIYGCSESSGYIYAFDQSTLTPSVLTTLTSTHTPYTYDLTCYANSFTNVVYSFGSYYGTDPNPGDQNNNYLCATTLPNGNTASQTACYGTAVYENPVLNTQVIQGAAGIFYVETTDYNGNVTIQSYTLANNLQGVLSISQNFNLPNIITVDTQPTVTLSNLQYNSLNNSLYFTSSSNKVYQLNIMDGTLGTLKTVHTFSSNEKVSAPFITTNGKIIVVVQNLQNPLLSYVYGTTTAGAGAFGPNLYSLPLPQASIPATALINFDSTVQNTLIIPASLTTKQSYVSFSFDMNQ